MAAVNRSNALRAGGACVRCRKGKTKCFYETGDPPCRNCEKGGHACYLPGERDAPSPGPRVSSAHHRPSRDSVPASADRAPVVASATRHVPSTVDKLTPELVAECEKIISKTFPASVAFQKHSIVQQLKAGTIEMVLVYGLLTCASRHSSNLIRRYGSGSATAAAEGFAAKALALVNQNIDTPSLADIQAMCLLVIHEWGSKNAVRAYIYLGWAARMLHMYRIIKNSQPNASDSDRFNNEESLRRTVWLIFVLDCMLTTISGRHPALREEDYKDLPLPCPELNYTFGNTVWVKTISGRLPPDVPADAVIGDVGDFGSIVLAAKVWRDVVQTLTTYDGPLSEETCGSLLGQLGSIRDGLPVQNAEKAQHINLHITMGTGFTYAMLHSLLHCSSIFVQRKVLLQNIVSENYSLEAFTQTPQCYDVVNGLLSSCQSVLALLNALDAQADSKDAPTCFPIFMLFAAFTASVTVAYLSLKGLTPTGSTAMAFTMVRDGLHFMEDGTELWPLLSPWRRHLAVMYRVLERETDSGSSYKRVDTAEPHAATAAMQSRDDTSSTAATSPGMDYEQASSALTAAQSVRAQSGSARGDSEPPMAPLPRRTGITTINGSSTPGTGTPPPGVEVKHESSDRPRVPLPGAGTNGESNASAAQAPAPSANGEALTDMTADELCAAFERQLINHDDLAAFMGGGV